MPAQRFHPAKARQHERLFRFQINLLRQGAPQPAQRRHRGHQQINPYHLYPPDNAVLGHFTASLRIFRIYYAQKRAKITGLSQMPLSALVPSRKNGSPEDPQTFRACSICHKRFFRSAKAWHGGGAPYFSSCKVPVPPSTTPSCLSTAVMVPKKHFTSSPKLICSTYQPSSFAFSAISSSSRPWIWAQPVRPGRTSLALDMMEELRAYLGDRFILSLINKRQISVKDFLFQGDNGVVMTDKGKKTFISAWQARKREVIIHPYLNEKVEIGLLPYVQAMLMARYIRQDIDDYPVFLIK